ncbi:hypothetical protein [Leucobacter sp. cx-169]|uniref:hypothetical protein n=1 Tax=Leucobacter sp. cx-169 TaxID=2770549 RepID=UPI00165E7665|nr:hypothetical protein [Leucobacter sp. cx-169]MBC9927208.1 hypothetical protein [Leucobacter sp. cx-169]
MSRRWLIPYRLYRWAGDRFMGKFLVYGFKREIDRGDLHEANHLAAGVQLINSTPCSQGELCTLHLPVRPVLGGEDPRR